LWQYQGLRTLEVTTNGKNWGKEKLKKKRLYRKRAKRNWPQAEKGASLSWGKDTGGRRRNKAGNEPPSSPVVF